MPPAAAAADAADADAADADAAAADAAAADAAGAPPPPAGRKSIDVNPAAVDVPLPLPEDLPGK